LSTQKRSAFFDYLIFKMGAVCFSPPFPSHPKPPQEGKRMSDATNIATDKTDKINEQHAPENVREWSPKDLNEPESVKDWNARLIRAPSYKMTQEQFDFLGHVPFLSLYLSGGRKDDQSLVVERRTTRGRNKRFPFYLMLPGDMFYLPRGHMEAARHAVFTFCQRYELNWKFSVTIDNRDLNIAVARRLS